MIFPSIAAFEEALASPRGPDRAAEAAARARQITLTKPAGSLGRLEEIAIFFAGWQGRERPRIDRGRAVVFRDMDDLQARINLPDLDVTPDDVLVLQGSGDLVQVGHHRNGAPQAEFGPTPARPVVHVIPAE